MLTDDAQCQLATAANPQSHHGTLWPGVIESFKFGPQTHCHFPAENKV